MPGFNINQIPTAATSILATDKMYLGRSPFDATDDRYILGSVIISQLAPLTTKGDLYTFTTVNARLPVAVGDGKILQVSSGAATGLAYSTPTYPSASGTAGKIIASDGTNNIYSTATFPIVGGAAGNILISNGTNYIASTSLWPNTVGTTGTILRSNGTSNAYTTSTFADTYAVSTILYASASNVVTGLATINQATLVTGATGIPAWQAMSAGQILVGTTAGAPTATAINSGTNILVSNGSGTITVNATGIASFVWNNVTISTQLLAVNQGYMTNDVSLLVTYTLPTTAAIGTIISIAGNSSNGWTIAQNASQNIQVGSVSSTIGATGTVSSSNRYDQISLLCVVANTTWVATSVIGNLTIV
jgi:hypothetical protein